METQLIMSIADILNITSISNNIDEALITGFAYNAQLKYTESALGIALYTDLLNVNATGGTKYNELLQGYLYPALAFLTMSDALPFIHSRISSIGVITSNTDTGTAASDTTMANLQKSLEASGNFYLNRMIDYLDDNQSLYPLYRSTNCTTSGKRSTSSIYLPKTNRVTQTFNPRTGNYI